MSDANTAADRARSYSSTPDDPSGTGGFEELPITFRDHLDPDKHWIGDALPAPSIGEVRAAGQVTDEGDSPFPARADHTHDVKPGYSVYYIQTVNTILPGTGFIGNWVHAGGTNILASGSFQRFEFMREGTYTISCTMDVLRQGGGTFTGAIDYLARFNSPSPFDRRVHRHVMSTEVGYYTFNFTTNFSTSGGGGQDVQFYIANGDVNSWLISSTELYITRTSSIL